jgi:xanthine dehydrogenase YagS FAD-binding subunit
MMPAFAYARPGSLEDAVRLLAREGARAHAGGTDLLGCLRDGVLDVRSVVSLAGIPELWGIEERGDGSLRIGAMVRLAELAASPLVTSRWRGLAEAAGAAASPQLRHQGTIGGNLCQKPRCWYYRGEFACLRKGGATCFAAAGQNQYHAIFGGRGCHYVHPSDPAPALCALGASATLIGARGRRAVPLEEFYVLPEVDPTRETVLEPGEVLVEVLVPAPARGLRSAYRKVRARGAWDFALAGMAAAVVREGNVVRSARVFLSGVAPAPWRAGALEDAVRDRGITEDVLRDAARAAVRDAEPLGGNRYKTALVEGLVREVFAA